MAQLWHWRSVGGYLRDIDVPANTDIILSYAFTGPYAAILGFIIFRYEKWYALSRNDHHSYVGKPRLGYYYILSAIPAFFSYATMLPAVIAIGCGIVNIIATKRIELGNAKDGGYIFWGIWDWDKDRGTYFVARLFLFLNFIVFAYNYVVFEIFRQYCLEDNAASNTPSCLSPFGPMAKGFGNCINLNAAGIVLPVLRTLLRSAADRYDRNNIFPFKKAIEFHKIIGLAVFCAVTGHMVFHYLNYALTPEISILTFGNSAYITGAILIVVMSIMYSGAHYIVRRANYEIFWNSHHFYVLFFFALISHAPHFWQWFLIPAVLFITEKRRRASARGTRKIFVESAEFVPPVLNINFSPEKIEDFEFRGGQYLYLMVPAISEVEWHPFSMSSAFGDLEASGFVSVHIRVRTIAFYLNTTF